jgi:hypothetical protein
VEASETFLSDAMVFKLDGEKSTLDAEHNEESAAVAPLIR